MLLKAKARFSAACQKAITDAGYEATINAGASTSQVKLSSGDLINSLQGAEQAGTALTAARLRQMALRSLNDPARASRMNRPPLTDELEKLAQLTIAINFDLGSARIRPDSFQAVGLMADSLDHPYLQSYRFLIVGHTDARGNREVQSEAERAARRRDSRSVDQSVRDSCVAPRVGGLARSNC